MFYLSCKSVTDVIIYVKNITTKNLSRFILKNKIYAYVLFSILICYKIVKFKPKKRVDAKRRENSRRMSSFVLLLSDQSKVVHGLRRLGVLKSFDQSKYYYTKTHIDRY